MNQNRRMGDRRRTVRRHSNEIIDGYTFVPPTTVPFPAAWPFPIISDQVTCGTCGWRYPGNAIGSHKCAGRA